MSHETLQVVGIEIAVAIMLVLFVVSVPWEKTNKRKRGPWDKK